MKTYSQEYKQQLIATNPFFQNLPPHIIESLCLNMQEVRFRQDDVIVQKGEFATDFYLILDGKAKVIADEVNDGSTPTAMLEPGEMIGFSSHGFYSTTGKRVATVTAMTTLDALRLNIETLDSIIRQLPDADAILSNMSLWLLKLNFIKKIGPFSQLSNDNIYNVAKCITMMEIPENKEVVKVGEHADCCYLLLEGKVEVIALRADGSTQRMAILTDNSLFGEAGILTTGRRNSTVRTLTPCKLLVLRRGDLIKLLKSDEAFTHSLVGFMVNRFQPAINPNVIVNEAQTLDGREIVTLEQKEFGYFYRLNKESQFIWKHLDGVNTIQELTILFFNEFKSFSPDAICNLLYDLAQREFVIIPTINIDSLHSNQLSLWQRFTRKLHSYTQKEFTLVGTDSYFSEKYQRGFYLLFKWPMQLFFLATILYGLYFLVTLNHGLPSSRVHLHPDLINLWYFIILIIPINVMTIILHEFSHAITTKHFSYKVNRFGLGWYWFSPIVYADTSEIWRANRKQKLAVDIAGIYADLFIASVFMLFAAFYRDTEMFSLLWLISVFTYFHAFKNLSPLREYDGCFILMDLLGKQTLRSDAYHWLIQWRAHPTKFKGHFAEACYWAACLLYLILLFGFTYLILSSFLSILGIESVLGFSSQQIAITIPTLIFFLSLLSIGRELRHTKLTFEHQAHEQHT